MATSKHFKSKFKQYLWNNLISFDQVWNTLLGGDPDETLSSRMGKRPRDKCAVCYWVCKFLNLFESDHCQKAVELDRGKRSVIK